MIELNLRNTQILGSDSVPGSDLGSVPDSRSSVGEKRKRPENQTSNPPIKYQHASQMGKDLKGALRVKKLSLYFSYKFTDNDTIF